MKQKRTLIFTLITIAVLAAGICIAVFTRVPIPMGSENQLRVYARNKPEAEINVAGITPEGADINA